ncbi:MAG: septum formation inhibitor Maf, partial [Bradymonadaceae bacterium]
MPSSYRIIRLLTLLAVLSLLSCTTTVAENRGVGQFAELDAERQGSASSPFWDHWGDGKAELTSYKGRIARYGELREATAVLIYVTEPTHRESWIKDDDAQGVDRVDVLKLNHTISFSTGIYPYSVMTSTFSPVDDWGRERFFPAKINLSVQE